MNEYRGYANTDVELRQHKAEKIRRILQRRIDLGMADVLDLGAGSGHITRFLRPFVKSITAADREIKPLAMEHVEIKKTSGVLLPFSESCFDVVIYNHVLEHVGDRVEQMKALSEIVRVTRPGGLVYLATPNRWTVMEPHFRLPILSWLPQPLADAYVRAARRGTWYDCNPFARRELCVAIRLAKLDVEDVTQEAIRVTVDIERKRRVARELVVALPEVMIKGLASIAPTFVVIGRKRVEPSEKR